MTKEELTEARVNEYLNKPEQIRFFHSDGGTADRKEDTIKFAFKYLFNKDIELTREYCEGPDGSTVKFKATVPHHFYTEIVCSPYFQEDLCDKDGHLLWCRFVVSF